MNAFDDPWALDVAPAVDCEVGASSSVVFAADDWRAVVLALVLAFVALLVRAFLAVAALDFLAAPAFFAAEGALESVLLLVDFFAVAVGFFGAAFFAAEGDFFAAVAEVVFFGGVDEDCSATAFNCFDVVVADDSGSDDDAFVRDDWRVLRDDDREDAAAAPATDALSLPKAVSCVVRHRSTVVLSRWQRVPV